MSILYASSPCVWAPGLSTTEDVALYAKGQKNIAKTTQTPPLSFTEPLFRRRLGQLCKMTVQVVHDALSLTSVGDIPQAFVTLRGEINREFTVNRTLIQENAILPAAFSLSVFNAPIALASIALGLKSGYSVIIPERENFYEALITALAPIMGGTTKKLLFVYGDELVPEEYGSLRPLQNEPLSYAMVIAQEATQNVQLRFSLEEVEQGTTPANFLKLILRKALV